MKKKFLVITICFIIFFILVNIFYNFFYGDDIDNIMDKILFRKNYYLREIIECNYDKNSSECIISKGNISIRLNNINYENSNRTLKVNFDFYTNDSKPLKSLRSMLRVHDDSNIYYNKSIGDRTLFVGNTDYLLYNKNLYSQISTKGFLTNQLNEDEIFDFSNTINSNCLQLELMFDLDKDNELSKVLYIEFLDLIYKCEYDNSNKIFYPIGECKFIIDLKNITQN